MIRTTEDMRRAIRDREQKLGLIPGEFEAVWGQESEGSLDPTLQGRTPTRHGRAQGPFQVMASLHPGFTPGSDLEAQLDYAIKFYASGGPDPSSRRQAYYGKGKAPPGQPTTAEYDQQVAARMGQPLQVAQAGRADIMPGLLSQQQAPSMPMAGETEMPSQGQDFMGGLLDDPRFMMGASILASKDIGKGLLGGAVAAENMQMRRLQVEMMRRKQQEEALKQQMTMEFMRRLQGGGGEGGMAGGMAPMDMAKFGMMGAIAGVPGADAVMRYGLATAPYNQMTLAEQAAEQQRQWSRNKDEMEMRDKGVMPPTGGAPAGQPALGLSPEAIRDLAKKKEEARTISTADQKKAAGWADRMLSLEPDIKKLEDKFSKSGGIPYKDYYAGQNVITNTFASPEYQAYLTQSRDWIGGLLRYESGAAVPEPEFWRYYQTYFAQPGDDPSVVDIKRNLRRRAAASLGTAAGAAMIPRNAASPPPPPPEFTERVP